MGFSAYLMNRKDVDNDGNTPLQRLRHFDSSAGGTCLVLSVFVMVSNEVDPVSLC